MVPTLEMSSPEVVGDFRPHPLAHALQTSQELYPGRSVPTVFDGLSRIPVKTWTVAEWDQLCRVERLHCSIASGAVQADQTNRVQERDVGVRHSGASPSAARRRTIRAIPGHADLDYGPNQSLGERRPLAPPPRPSAGPSWRNHAIEAVISFTLARPGRGCHRPNGLSASHRSAGRGSALPDRAGGDRAGSCGVPTRQAQPLKSPRHRGYAGKREAFGHFAYPRVPASVLFGLGLGLVDGRLVLLGAGLQLARAGRRRQCRKHRQTAYLLAGTGAQAQR